MEAVAPEVYSLDEIARAAYVDAAAAEALASRGRVPFVPGTRFVAETDAVAAARVLRHAALLAATEPAETDLFALTARGRGEMPRPGAWSMVVHLTVALGILGLGRPAAPAAATTAELQPSRLVFLVEPGPGGGGGGGGARAPRPATRLLERSKTPQPQAVSVPETQRPPAPAPEPQPEPPPAKPVEAPLAQVAAAVEQRQGEIDAPANPVPSAGPGVDGAGSGRNGGNGPGRGNGVGDGVGGGTGGGVYRPGSGIEPPRLLREVKASYTEEARRAGITGDVVMEVVVRADGTVASPRITRGLGYGLDERALAAVREWKFAPARRLGVPVDVAVEVAMEFNLR